MTKTKLLTQELSKVFSQSKLFPRLSKIDLRTLLSSTYAILSAEPEASYVMAARQVLLTWLINELRLIEANAFDKYFKAGITTHRRMQFQGTLNLTN